MDDADKAIWDSEERSILSTLSRSMAALREAHVALGLWITMGANGPPPRDVNRAAFDAQTDAMALYRHRLLRDRMKAEGHDQ